MDLKAIKAQRNDKIAEVIREMSRLKFGRDQALVEAEIDSRRARL